MAETENAAFDRWCFATKDARTGLPMLTTLLYAVCDNDRKKFEEAMDILQKAYEAGQKVGAA